MLDFRSDLSTRFTERLFVAILLTAALVLFLTATANAQTIAFKQAVAAAALDDVDIAAFYQERDYRPIWTGDDDQERRKAFLAAVGTASDHGLPAGRYDAEQLIADFGAVKTARGRGYLEVETTKRFLLFAHDIQSGILDPDKLSEDIAVVAPRRDRLVMLREFSESVPSAFLRNLPPKHPDYARLLKEKARLENILATGDWGATVNANKLKPGRKHEAVAAMRNRLYLMGYVSASESNEYSDDLVLAVQQFQTDHGLTDDGVAGNSTIDALNVSVESQLKQVIIGLERQRWLNLDRGKRHIFVNQADFKAYVFDDGKATFETRVVVGKTSSQYRTPEFTDEMTHLIINPTWHVPQSIARKEYLPMLLQNPGALGRQGIVMTDISGQKVDPSEIDFTQYSTSDFPFDLKQPPGSANALGKVKFMFPNKFNVYLHDTPSKSLFGRDIRAFSHGCVRVQRPMDLAYFLLAPQSDDPEGLFNGHLKSRRETQVDLVTPIPVYLVYHTVWVTAQGRVNYRLDPYGRDKLVFEALEKAGVELRAPRS